MGQPRRRSRDDEVISAWPWFGGMPGKVARKIFTLWVTALVLLAVFTLYSFVTLQIC